MERDKDADGGADDDPQALPKEIARREALRDRLNFGASSPIILQT